MSGEYIITNSIEEYWAQLKAVYESRSTEWEDLTKKKYEALEHSEREDSDNHLNKQRLDDDNDTNVVDYCHYKYLPDRKAAYHVQIVDKKGNSEDHYFQITLKEEAE